MVGVFIFIIEIETRALLIRDSIPLARPWGRAPFPARWGSLYRPLGRGLFYFAAFSPWAARSLARSPGLACAAPGSALSRISVLSPRSALSLQALLPRVAVFFRLFTTSASFRLATLQPRPDGLGLGCLAKFGFFGGRPSG